MSAYDKAEQMKRQLDAKIAAIEASFDNLRKFEEAASKLSTQYNSVCRMNEEVGEKVSEFEASSSKVESMEQRFNYMMKLSGEIDAKVRTLTQSSDNLTDLEVKVRNFQDAVNKSHDMLETLEQKNSVLERVSHEVTEAFDR